MLAPFQWIHAYADINDTAENFADRMIMTGTEVEEIQNLSAGLDHVVVGRITHIEPHPNSDHLQVCTMDVGTGEELIIITGADNVFEGALVPAALIGAKLPCGLEIKKGRLRGMDSMGMLCSGEELGIKDDVYPGAEYNGIMILHEEDLVPGTPIAKVLGMDEKVLDFKILANRPDCMSILGLAREGRAVMDVKGCDPNTDFTTSDFATSDFIRVDLQNREKCLRYMANVVRNVKIGPSPKWMRERLMAAGQRPINNIVDITNYVMLEIGQPLHAFDLRYVKGNEIVIRNAEAGETLMTLDEKDRELSDSMLVICNSEGPMAVAGVMGGENSGIMDDTVDVVFEAATFDSTSIRKTSRALGLRTESSSRFEKGVGIDMAELGMRRAMALICELGCGEVAQSWIDEGIRTSEPVKLHITPFQVSRLLGSDIPVEAMVSILNRLHFDVKFEDGYLDIIVPSFRRDITGPADIAEEVQRIYGYDTIPNEPINGAMHRGALTPVQKARYELKDLMAGLGFYETLNYSFMAPAVLDKLGLPQDSELRRAVRIRNPLGEDYSLMRTSLIPALLNNILTNQNRRAENIRLFEMSRVFTPKELPLNEQPVETLMLSFGIAGKDADFFTAKGILEALFSVMRVKGVQFKAGGNVYYHPGRKAVALLGNEILAEVGEIHPDVAEAFGLSGRIVCAQVNTELMIAKRQEDVTIQPLPKYPSVKLDLAVTVDDIIPAGDMLQLISDKGGAILEACDVFDVYRGAQVGEGKKSIAFSLEFRAEDHTLTDEEVSRVYDKILRNLERSFQAVRR